MRDHAQLIVNQRCNLIIQYLDKQSRDDYDDDDEDTEDENHDELCGHSHMFNLAANSATEKVYITSVPNLFKPVLKVENWSFY